MSINEAMTNGINQCVPEMVTSDGTQKFSIVTMSKAPANGRLLCFSPEEWEELQTHGLRMYPLPSEGGHQRLAPKSCVHVLSQPRLTSSCPTLDDVNAIATMVQWHDIHRRLRQFKKDRSACWNTQLQQQYDEIYCAWAGVDIGNISWHIVTQP